MNPNTNSSGCVKGIAHYLQIRLTEFANPTGLQRDPAGLEVRVNDDMITREFFGREQHGHQVNRLWGWVEVPWLPILGNRTDYLRDSPQGRAFYTTVKEIFDQAFKKDPLREGSP